MRISVEDLSRLARLSLTDEETIRFGGQLDQIVTYIDKLNELDTSGVEPTSHVVELCNVFREDIANASLQREEALANAPDHTDRFYRVPKIIE